MKILIFLLLSFCGLKIRGIEDRYEANWKSLDSRPLPAWYDEAKIGIFIHWGIFSVPAFGSEWFWHSWNEGYEPVVNFMKRNYPPGFTYQDFAPQFTADLFEPEKWAELFSRAGARYVVLTSKHHEGYTLWPSNYSYSWNAKDVGPGRDLVGELATAIRALSNPPRFGVYHSLYEWYNPLYLSDAASKFSTREFVETKTMPELYELVNKYDPEIVWSDGDHYAPDTYWGSVQFLAWLFTDSAVRETVVTNDRWGNGTQNKHGSFYNGKDGFNPGVVQAHKWENCMSLDKTSWGHSRKTTLEKVVTIEELIKIMAETVSCGGNLLVNVGPTKDGIIPLIFEERLTQMGDWLQINGEAIYGTKPWAHQNDTYTPGVWYTQNKKQNLVYAIVLSWPVGGSVVLSSVVTTPMTEVYMKGFITVLTTKEVAEGLEVFFPPLSDMTSRWSWVLELHQVKANSG